MPRGPKMQDKGFRSWVMTHPTEYQPNAVAKHPPPTLRHYLIETCKTERELAAGWVWEEKDEEEEYDEGEGKAPNSDGDDIEDSRFDWYTPSTKPVPAPSLVPVCQKGPPKFVPLNTGWGRGKGPSMPARMRSPMGYAAPITHPSVIQNPFRHQKGMQKGMPNKGWIPPQPPHIPPMQMGPPQPKTGSLQTPVSQMVPVYGFASMAMGAQPPLTHGPQLGAPYPMTHGSQMGGVPTTRRRRRREEED